MKCPECGAHVIYDPNGYCCSHCDWEESVDGDDDELDVDDNDGDWEPDYGGDDDE